MVHRHHPSSFSVRIPTLFRGSRSIILIVDQQSKDVCQRTVEKVFPQDAASFQQYERPPRKPPFPSQPCHVNLNQPCGILGDSLTHSMPCPLHHLRSQQPVHVSRQQRCFAPGSFPPSQLSSFVFLKDCFSARLVLNSAVVARLLTSIRSFPLPPQIQDTPIETLC